jgi:proline iminopeptidase
MVAIVYAATYPERVDHLVLVATRIRESDERRAIAKRGIGAKLEDARYADARAALERLQSQGYSSEEELGRLMVRFLPLTFGQYGRSEAEALERIAPAFRHPNEDARRFWFQQYEPSIDLRSQLARVVAPTLIIGGEADFMVPPLCADEMATVLPGAQTVILPDVGHAPFVEAPAQFRQAVLAFFASA